MMSGFTRRGQPLLALVLLLGGWVSARAVMWEPKAGLHIDLSTVTDGAGEPRQLAALSTSARLAPQMRAAVSSPAVPAMSASPALADPDVAALPRAVLMEVQAGASGDLAPLPPPPPRQAVPPAPQPAFAPVPARTAVGHHMLWMAALARVPMPAAFADLAAGGSTDSQVAPLAAQPPQHGPRRWSADGWILWRRGSTGLAGGGLLTPSYGASQAGAVVRYRLAPSNALRPAAYLRTTAALNGSSEREAALGLQLRPVASLPIAVAGEARLTAVPGRTFVRPAIFAVTELAPFALPLGLRGDAYGQAGYVGGRFATGFADGHVRVERRLAPLGKGELRFGGGLWGGVQKGASRLDAGPTVTIGQSLGGSGSLNLAADWRFRVAGKAAPGSGPAVTLSAGF